jgi:pilus assembly protein CpaF
MAMSLRSYLEVNGRQPLPCESPARLQKAQLIALRDALYERIAPEKIARLLVGDATRARVEVEAVLSQLVQEAPYALMPAAECAELKTSVADLVLGLGPIEELLAAPAVTEIMVVGAEKVFYEQEGRLYRSQAAFVDEQQLRMVIDRIVGPLGRRVDEQSPMVNARLPQGHRVNAVIAPLALDGAVLTIRKFREQNYSLDELVGLGTLSAELATLLRWAVLCRRNIVTSGGTGSGKTTMLNALSEQIPADERIVTIEDAAELRFTSHPHVVRLEARQASVEGSGEVSIRDLVVNALRMRPDRIIVGECRGGEALDMLQAMNTGHEGSLTSLHANSPAEVVNRLVMMARYAMDLPVALIEEQIASALDLVVQIDRMPDGQRKVTALATCVRTADKGVQMQTIARLDRASGSYVWDHTPAWLDDARFAETLDVEEVAQWHSSLAS